MKGVYSKDLALCRFSLQNFEEFHCVIQLNSHTRSAEHNSKGSGYEKVVLSSRSIKVAL